MLRPFDAERLRRTIDRATQKGLARGERLETNFPVRGNFPVDIDLREPVYVKDQTSEVLWGFSSWDNSWGGG